MADQSPVEWRTIFEMFDTDGDGSISVKELESIMKSLGHNLTEVELLDLVKEFDFDGNGEIDYEEFQALAKKCFPNGAANPSTDELKEIFKLADKDEKGYITANELRELFGLMGETATDEDIDDMIEVADFDNDGKINMDDFIQLMKVTGLS